MRGPCADVAAVTADEALVETESWAIVHEWTLIKQAAELRIQRGTIVADEMMPCLLDPQLPSCN
jgi:hypothetical protein